MESRKITVMSTKSQKKSIFMSEAETLGQLKEDMNKNGIDYDGMTVYEGLSKTELKSDDSLLPKNIEHKGVVTNELVFMHTNSNKKIKSGITITNRHEASLYFKANPDKAAEFKELHGKNWTNCSNHDILEFINSKEQSIRVEPKNENSTEEDKHSEEIPNNVLKEINDKIEFINSKIDRLTVLLYDNDALYGEERDEILDMKLPEISKETKEELKSSYSDEELDAMMKEAKNN